MALPIKTHFTVTTPDGDTLNVVTLSDLSLGKRRGEEFHIYADHGEGIGTERISDALGLWPSVGIRDAIAVVVRAKEPTAYTTELGYRVTRKEWAA